MDWEFQDAILELGGPGDLPGLYGNLLRQFPPEELYPYGIYEELLQKGNYLPLLYRRKDGEPVGCALVCTLKRSGVLWLDYIAILPEFHSQGYGSRLFRALEERFSAEYRAMMFSVEHIDPENRELARIQRRRLSFYERLGAVRLRGEFLLPLPSGSYPMYAFCKPWNGLSSLSAAEQAGAVRELYEKCSYYLPGLDACAAHFEEEAEDIRF